MANDSPKLNGYTFKIPPPKYSVQWQPQLTQHRLSDGSLASYNKGYILKGVMEWGDGGWITQDDLSNITIMYNEMTATAQFYPRPDTQAARVFNVRIVNEFNFVPLESRLNTVKQLYEGSIEIESSLGENTATASEVL